MSLDRAIMSVAQHRITDEELSIHKYGMQETGQRGEREVR